MGAQVVVYLSKSGRRLAQGTCGGESKSAFGRGTGFWRLRRWWRDENGADTGEEGEIPPVVHTEVGGKRRGMLR